jgi:hypothetical protein
MGKPAHAKKKTLPQFKVEKTAVPLPPAPGLWAPPQPSPLDGDLMRGGFEIADFLFPDDPDRLRRRKRLYRLVYMEEPPPFLFRLGLVICARKSAILRWIEEQERGGRRDDEDAANSSRVAAQHQSQNRV